ncbi:MAG: hypothetical protein JEY99_21765 [Spirochaetales bacterium]|nr:hypothetical protein [Spirochaetales bacterium]
MKTKAICGVIWCFIEEIGHGLWGMAGERFTDGRWIGMGLNGEECGVSVGLFMMGPVVNTYFNKV